VARKDGEFRFQKFFSSEKLQEKPSRNLKSQPSPYGIRLRKLQKFTNNKHFRRENDREAKEEPSLARRFLPLT
jgi:hypothetical protein